MKTLTWILAVAGFVGVLHVRGLESAAVASYYGEEDNLDNTLDNGKAQEAVEELAKLLISSGTTADGRTGRALIGPGKWCALPFPILNAVRANLRSSRTLGMFSCTPPAWKQQYTKFTKGTTSTVTSLCLYTSDAAGNCISEP